MNVDLLEIKYDNLLQLHIDNDTLSLDAVIQKSEQDLNNLSRELNTIIAKGLKNEEFDSERVRSSTYSGLLNTRFKNFIHTCYMTPCTNRVILHEQEPPDRKCDLSNREKKTE